MAVKKVETKKTKAPGKTTEIAQPKTAEEKPAAQVLAAEKPDDETPSVVPEEKKAASGRSMKKTITEKQEEKNAAPGKRTKKTAAAKKEDANKAEEPGETAEKNVKKAEPQPALTAEVYPELPEEILPQPRRSVTVGTVPFVTAQDRDKGDCPNCHGISRTLGQV